MLIYDSIVNWMEPGQELTDQNNFDTACRIRIIKLNSVGGLSFLKKYYIIASDLGGKSGEALTRSAEALIPFVCATHNIDYPEMLWFEHHPHTDSDADSTLEVVIPTPAGCSCPSACSQRLSLEWRPARINEIEHLKQFVDI